MPAVLEYSSLIPDGLSTVRFPSRSSQSTCEPAPDMSDLDDTCRLPAFSTDQPPASLPAVALTVSVNVTSIRSRETALVPFILGAWPSAIVRSNSWSSPIGLPDSSTTRVWFMVSVPVALDASTGSNVIACMLLLPVPWRAGVREPPGSNSSPVYAAETLATGSLYSTARRPGCTIWDRVIDGAIPSATASESDPSRLPRMSATAPDDGGAYDTLTPVGLSAFRPPPPRKRASTVEPADTSDLDDTAGLPAPDTDHPPAPEATWPRTASENVTFICARETASASVMTGGWPSPAATMAAALSPTSTLPDSSTSTLWFIVSVPVAPVPSGMPPMPTSCRAEAPPDEAVVVRVTPGDSSRPPYADGTGTTGSVYATAIVRGPVMLAERKAGLWPSSRVSEVVMGSSALPDMSARTAGLTASVPSAFAAAVTEPAIVISCVGRWALSVSNVIELMDPPGERFRFVYAFAARATGSLYVMVIRSAAVMFDEVTVGLWPSFRSSWVVAW